MVRGGALVGGGGGVLLGVRNRAFHIQNNFLPKLDITILVYNMTFVQPGEQSHQGKYIRNAITEAIFAVNSCQ